MYYLGNTSLSLELSESYSLNYGETKLFSIPTPKLRNYTTVGIYNKDEQMIYTFINLVFMPSQFNLVYKSMKGMRLHDAKCAKEEDSKQKVG